MNEAIPNIWERRAQLWLGRLLQEDGMIHALNGYIYRKRPGSSVGDKYEDIRQTALLGAWNRIALAIAERGEVQTGDTTEKSAVSDEQELVDPDAELAPDFGLKLWTSINEHDEAAFRSVAKTLIFNQIGYKGADLTRKETQQSVQTVPLDPETVGVAPLRRNEKSAPIDYSEPRKRPARGADPQIDPDLSFPETREEVEEREEDQSEGQRLKESWLNWLWAIHDRTTDPLHKRRVKACIEFERLAFIDVGEVTINLKIRKPEDNDPYLYHGILGRTHGARPKLAKQHGISLRYFEIELRLMREQYWPAWVATVIEEKN